MASFTGAHGARYKSASWISKILDVLLPLFLAAFALAAIFGNPPYEEMLKTGILLLEIEINFSNV
jgi:hypothetical protein